MKRDHAETVALQGLAHLADDEALLAQFMMESGATIQTLRDNARDPAMLAAVLDFLLQDDRRILAFAAASGLPPALPAEARACLPGGTIPNWT